MHDIEVITETWTDPPKRRLLLASIQYALNIGKGRCMLLLPSGEISWFSLHKSDPITGEAYPNLEPSLLSWNSPRGWCSSCRGYGKIYDWMKEELPANGEWWSLPDGGICPTCNGDRLGSIGRNTFLFAKSNRALSMPQLLALPPDEVKSFLNNLK